MAMNQFGRTAMAYWEEHRASEVAAMADPLKHFSLLGDEIADAIADREHEYLDRTVDQRDFQANLAALAQARLQATEVVLAEYLPPVG